MLLIQWKKTRCFLFGLLCVLAPFLPLLLNSENALLYRDLSQIHIPLKSIWLNSVLELGRVTHWNPYALLGTPFLADNNCGPLYPLNWIIYAFRSWGVPRALAVFLLAHHLLIYAGGYLLLRQLRCRPVFSMLGALTLALGGMAMSSENLGHALCCQVAPPLFFLFLLRSKKEASFSLNLVLASGMLALPIYGGDPQYTYILALTSFFLLMRTHGWRSGLLRYASLGVLTVLAAAPQMLPTISFIPETGRASGGNLLPGLLVWSMHPIRFLEALFPLAFGDLPSNYWGYIFLNSFPLPVPFVFSIYLGALPVLFLAIWFFSSLKKWRTRLHPGKALVFILFSFAVMGEFSPLPIFQLLAKYFPLWSSFRHPERLAYWPSFTIIVAAFMCAERLWRAKKIGANLKISYALGALLIVCAAFTAFLRWHQAPLLPVLIAAVLLLAYALLFKRTTRWALPLIALLAVLDLGLFAKRMVWTQPVAFTSAEDNFAVSKIRADLVRRKEEISLGGSARFYAESAANPSALGGTELSELDQDMRFTWAMLDPNISSYFRIEDARGHFGLMPRRAVDIWQTLLTAGPERLLDLLSIRYRLYLKDGKPNVASSFSALPFVLLPQTIELLPADQAERRLVDPKWNFRTSALIEHDDKSARGANSNWELLRVEKNWDMIHLQLRSKGSGDSAWIVLQESFNKNWSAVTANSISLKIRRANAWAIGLELPAASSKGQLIDVALRYEEPYYVPGLFLLGIWFVALLVSLGQWKRRKSPILVR